MKYYLSNWKRSQAQSDALLELSKQLSSLVPRVDKLSKDIDMLGQRIMRK